ncbi:hypothetical protein [Thermococcus sp. AM4]|uniref:hypothetical protein n=1 Tax=Thermococcus sp. (strain AM4) TaxID=246969 RepID=UPI000694712B|nr:hypothetical protein [Thermococcus sp. AM4]
MNPTGILGFIGVALYFVAILIIASLNAHPYPRECKSKECAKTGMNYGLELIGIGIGAFTLTTPMFLLSSDTASEGFTNFMLLAFSIMSTGLVLFGIWAWRSYGGVYKELSLQEAIAKGVEIGMKKAKEG